MFFDTNLTTKSHRRSSPLQISPPPHSPTHPQPDSSYTIADVLRTPHYVPADPPPVPPHLRVSLSVHSSHGQAKHHQRRVHVRMTGPDHMVLVLRDGPGGELVRWSYTPHLPSIPPKRHEGVRYVQITAGRCGPPRAGTAPGALSTPSPGGGTAQGALTTPSPGGPASSSATRCEYTAWFDVDGERPLEIALSGHYMGMHDTPALEELATDMPEWAKGAEWAKFASLVVGATG